MIQAVAHEPEQRVVLEGVSWGTYERLIAELGEAPAVRLTYDRGRLELMTTSRPHEHWKRLLGRLLETYTLERAIPIASGGAVTLRREDLARGLEPDECYWVAHEPAVRKARELDLTRDPPPDLAVEVVVSRPLLDKVAVYAALGVPELWRWDGAELAVFALEAGAYRAAPASRVFPELPLDEVARHLAQAGALDETALVRGFQRWVRATFPSPE